MRPSDELRGFVRFVEEVHPEPYRFVEPDALARTVDAEARRLDGLVRPGPFEVGRAYQAVIAELGDFHAQVTLPAYQPDYPGPLSLVPLALVRIGDRVFVDASIGGWPKGTELVRLDGTDAVELWDTLARLVSVDGKRPEVQSAVLERDFPKYFHFHAGMPATYDVVVRRPDGTEQAHTLEGVSADAYRELARRRGSLELPESPMWPSLERVDDTTAWLRLPSFGNPDLDAYRERVDALFADLEGIETLVVDVRGNPGGYRGHGVAVLNHLLDEPYRQWRSLSARISRIPRAYDDRVEPLLGDEATIRGSFPGGPRRGPQLRTDDPLAPVLKPVEPVFAGRVVLFVDAHTNSAANTFALALRRHHPALTVVGQEVGGDCDRHTGNFPVLYRTSSGVGLVISVMSVEHVEVAGCTPGRGLVPDIPVERTVDHYLTGADPYWSALETAQPTR